MSLFPSILYHFIVFPLCMEGRVVVYFLKKNLNASRPSEHPPVRGEMSKRLGGIIGCNTKPLHGI